MPTSDWRNANLEYLKKQAKDLREAIARGEAEAVARARRHLSSEDLQRAAQLSQAQHVLAREQGFDSWPKLKLHVEALQSARAAMEQATARAWTRADRVLDDYGSLVDQSDKAAGIRACLDGDLPVLPVRNAVLFPGASAPFAVARPSSLAMLEGLDAGAFVAVFCQHDPAIHEPTGDDLQPVGVLGRVHAMVPVPDQPTMLFVDGLERIALAGITSTSPYLRARVSVRSDIPNDGEVEALLSALRDTATRTLALMPGAPDNAQGILDRIAEPSELVDAIAANLEAPQAVKGALLAADTLVERLEKLLDLLRAQLAVLEAHQRALGGAR